MRHKPLRGTSRIAILLAGLLVSPLFAQSAPPVAGNGILATPAAAAYSDLTIASSQMLGDLKAAIPAATTVILYDAATFSAVPYYASAVDLTRTAAKNLCSAAEPKSEQFGPRAIVPTLDFGSAASGLASLIQLTIPSYTVQGQSLPLDNSALVGSFATAAKAAGLKVVNPAYLLPAVSQHRLTCDAVNGAKSLADLWAFASEEADKVRGAPGADKKPLKDAVDAFQKLRDVFLASDKGLPLLSRALIVETLGQIWSAPATIAAIDMRLDAVDIDTTTRAVLWWRSKKFSVNVAAHYWLFSAHGTGDQFGITLEQPGYVNILRKNVDEKSFVTGSAPDTKHRQATSYATAKAVN